MNYFSTIFSIRKWCWIDMCLVFECITKFFEMFITIVLSHVIGIGSSNTTLISFNVCFICITWVQQDVVAIYSTSNVDKDTESSFLLNQKTNLSPKKKCTTSSTSITHTTNPINISKGLQREIIILLIPQFIIWIPLQISAYPFDNLLMTLLRVSLIAPRAWYARLDKYLLQQGSKKDKVDINLYFKIMEDKLLIVVVYSDDVIFDGDDSVCKNFA